MRPPGARAAGCPRRRVPAPPGARAAGCPRRRVPAPPGARSPPTRQPARQEYVMSDAVYRQYVPSGPLPVWTGSAPVLLPV
ncbi:hypothetical protein GCM10010274_27860 [Streptomyces lavendofoliae]|uniref:Uncharacterized protein n=1 Tax=Streptomyces lavendofoliae TaxID=67314 RepID=A0A918HXP6_9ACTN|nr:hypothetical protein GCM10010274_27860 [Streptomyces lavendofoliae]